jgi:hypothetical protein
MSVKLTDAQLAMMSAAAQREDRCLTAPATMRDAAISKVSAKLAKLGLLREIRAKAGMPAWRRDKAGQGYALKLTGRRPEGSRCRRGIGRCDRVNRYDQDVCSS